MTNRSARAAASTLMALPQRDGFHGALTAGRTTASFALPPSLDPNRETWFSTMVTNGNCSANLSCPMPGPWGSRFNGFMRLFPLPWGPQRSMGSSIAFANVPMPGLGPVNIAPEMVWGKQAQVRYLRPEVSDGSSSPSAGGRYHRVEFYWAHDRTVTCGADMLARLLSGRAEHARNAQFTLERIVGDEELVDVLALRTASRFWPPEQITRPEQLRPGDILRCTHTKKDYRALFLAPLVGLACGHQWAKERTQQIRIERRAEEDNQVCFDVTYSPYVIGSQQNSLAFFVGACLTGSRQRVTQHITTYQIDVKAQHLSLHPSPDQARSRRQDLPYSAAVDAMHGRVRVGTRRPDNFGQLTRQALRQGAATWESDHQRIKLIHERTIESDYRRSTAAVAAGCLPRLRTCGFDAPNLWGCATGRGTHFILSRSARQRSEEPGFSWHLDSWWPLRRRRIVIDMVRDTSEARNASDDMQRRSIFTVEYDTNHLCLADFHHHFYAPLAKCRGLQLSLRPLRKSHSRAFRMAYTCEVTDAQLAALAQAAPPTLGLQKSAALAEVPLEAIENFIRKLARHPGVAFADHIARRDLLAQFIDQTGHRGVCLLPHLFADGCVQTFTRSDTRLVDELNERVGAYFASSGRPLIAAANQRREYLYGRIAMAQDLFQFHQEICEALTSRTAICPGAWNHLEPIDPEQQKQKLQTLCALIEEGLKRDLTHQCANDLPLPTGLGGLLARHGYGWTQAAWLQEKRDTDGRWLHKRVERARQDIAAAAAAAADPAWDVFVALRGQRRDLERLRAMLVAGGMAPSGGDSAALLQSVEDLLEDALRAQDAWLCRPTGRDRLWNALVRTYGLLLLLMPQLWGLCLALWWPPAGTQPAPGALPPPGAPPPPGARLPVLPPRPPAFGPCLNRLQAFLAA